MQEVWCCGVCEAISPMSQERCGACKAPQSEDTGRVTLEEYRKLTRDSEAYRPKKRKRR